jgi:hypothetical protein
MVEKKYESRIQKENMPEDETKALDKPIYFYHV